MKRDRLQDLINWRHSNYRKPLIIRGCRQVGKSWLVREFAKQFDTFIEINFEKNRQIHSFFDGDLDVVQLLDKLAIYANQKIVAGQTLIFFDEIQACENALKILRYFKEDKPNIHIIAAGSLLDFALEQHGIAVGRVQFMQLYPLSFGEYLSVLELEHLREHLKQQVADPVIHDQLMFHLKNYMWLGGMPAVIDGWIHERDPQLCQQLQDEIIEAYQIDFYKYAKERDISHVTSVFESIPGMCGQKFIFSKVDSDVRTEVIKRALLLLETAGIAKRCFHTSAHKQPLAAEQNEKKFKVFYFDIGIAQRLLGLDVQQWQQKQIPLANQGSIAEQFVAQELQAYSEYHRKSTLHYWHREARSSNAEVDFIVINNGEIVPIEVKSSKKGSMKSIQLFLDAHPNTSYALKISEGDFAKHNQLIEIPLYGIEAWLRAHQ